MKNKMNAILGVVLILIMLVTGCGGNGGENKDPNSGETKTKDTLYIGKGTDFNTIIPGSTNGPVAGEGIMFLAVYDTLINFDSTTGEYSPGLATDWKISEDGLEYTLNLRDDVYFHNGAKMTASDVAFSFNLLNENEAFKTSVYPTFDRAEVTGENTVTVYLKEPFAPFINALCSYVFAVVSEDYYNEVGGWDGYIAKPIGCGPYKYVSYERGGQMVLEANDNYYGEPAKIKKVVFRIIADNNSRIMALESGDVDVVLDGTINDVVRLDNVKGLKWAHCNAYGTACILFAHANPLISEDENLRKAICAAIDYEGLGAVINEGYSVKAELPAAPALTARPEDGTFTSSIQYDPEKAAEYLAASKYVAGTEIRYVVGSGSKNESIAKVVQGSLQSIGINCQIVSLDSATYSSAWVGGDYELLGTTVFPPHLDTNNMFTFFDSSMVITKGSILPGMDRINELGLAARVETQIEKRQELYAELGSILNEHALYVPLFYDLNTLAWNADLKNIDVQPFPNYNIAGWSW